MGGGERGLLKFLRNSKVGDVIQHFFHGRQPLDSGFIPEFFSGEGQNILSSKVFVMIIFLFFLEQIYVRYLFSHAK